MCQEAVKISLQAFLISQWLTAQQLSLQVSTREKEEELRKMQEKYGVDGEQHAREQAQGKRG